jgi:hypothetical protein
LKLENGNWKLDIRKSKLAIEITTSPPLDYGSTLVEFRISSFDFPFPSFQFPIPVMGNGLRKDLRSRADWTDEQGVSFEFRVSSFQFR